MPEAPSGRRPITSRDTKWAAAIAAALTRAGIRPNTISVFSSVFAFGTGLSLWLTPRVGAGTGSLLFFVAACGVGLRLLCNLFDGMVAIEGGFKTKSGDIYNELPDRFSDVFILLGCGYAAGSVDGAVTLGWLAAVLAVGTAYVRALGASAGAGQCFLGPMAKPQRMAVVIAACLAGTALVFRGWAAHAMTVALLVVVIGAAVTIVRRTRWVIAALEARA